MRRTYILAGSPVQRRGKAARREVQEHEPGMGKRVAVVVDNGDAVDVLEAIRRAYGNGREDKADETWQPAELDAALGVFAHEAQLILNGADQELITVLRARLREIARLHYLAEDGRLLRKPREGLETHR